MYSVYSYGTMIAPGPRVEAYAAALRRTIGPGCTVLELGTGTGFFALLACHLGADHVFAVEPDDCIQVARELAKANGCSDRITFIQALSTRVSLPRPADILVSDLRGTLPLFGQHLPSIIDARIRLLAPGGTMISKADRLMAVPVNAPDLFREHDAPWRLHEGIRMEQARYMALNTPRSARLKRELLLAEPCCWTQIDYRTVNSPHAIGRAAWTIENLSSAQGLGVWFDTDLCDGTAFSNAPDGGGIYGHMFFPWEAEVQLEPGDTVEVEFEFRLVAEEYISVWNTRVSSAQSRVKAEFRQSSFFSAARSAEKLQKRAADYAPKLSEDGKIAAFALNGMAGGQLLRGLAEQVMHQFPGRFGNFNAALSFVAELSAKYSD